MQLAASFARERKLFVQCALSALFYLLASVMFIVIGLLGDSAPLVYHVVFYLLEMLVFLDTSVVYVTLNNELKKEMRNFSMKKFVLAMMTQSQTNNHSNGWLSGLNW